MIIYSEVGGLRAVASVRLHITITPAYSYSTLLLFFYYTVSDDDGVRDNNNIIIIA